MVLKVTWDLVISIGIEISVFGEGIGLGEYATENFTKIINSNVIGDGDTRSKLLNPDINQNTKEVK